MLKGPGTTEDTWLGWKGTWAVSPADLLSLVT